MQVLVELQVLAYDVQVQRFFLQRRVTGRRPAVGADHPEAQRDGVAAAGGHRHRPQRVTVVAVGQPVAVDAAAAATEGGVAGGAG